MEHCQGLQPVLDRDWRPPNGNFIGHRQPNDWPLGDPIHADFRKPVAVPFGMIGLYVPRQPIICAATSANVEREGE